MRSQDENGELKKGSVIGMSAIKIQYRRIRGGLWKERVTEGIFRTASIRSPLVKKFGLDIFFFRDSKREGHYASFNNIELHSRKSLDADENKEKITVDKTGADLLNSDVNLSLTASNWYGNQS